MKSALLWLIAIAAPTAQAVEILVSPGLVQAADDGLCSLVEAFENANRDSQLNSSPGECIAGNGRDVIRLPEASRFDIPIDLMLIVDSDIEVAGNQSEWVSESSASIRVLADARFEIADLHIGDSDGILSSMPMQISQGAVVLLSRSVIQGMGDPPIFNEGDLVLIESEISGNLPFFGTGGVENRGSLTVLRSTIGPNAIQGFGGTGGISNFDGGVVFIEDSTIVGNSTGSMVGQGGGIANGGQMFIRNTSFVDNGARTEGGAIANIGLLVITNSTFAENFNGSIANRFGGTLILDHVTIAHTGPFAGRFENQGDLTMTNSIMSGPEGFPVCANSGTLTVGVNLIQDGTCGATLSGDPLLEPLGDFGGSTATLRPQLNSPAIDAGLAQDCQAQDQRGEIRSEFYCDLGAVERVDGIGFQNGFEGF